MKTLSLVPPGSDSSKAGASKPDQTLRPWERFIAHMGFVAEGVIYALMGLFALSADLARQRQPNGSEGALATLGGTNIGKALLTPLILGLAAFVVWQLILATIDPEHRRERRGLHRRLVRAGHFFNAIPYAVLLGEAIWLLFRPGTHGDASQSPVLWTSRALQLPLGRVWVGLVGVAIACFGCKQFYRAVTRDKIKRVNLDQTRLRLSINILGAIGYLSRGALFGVVGLYLLAAAWRADPKYSGGIAGALEGVAGQPYGRWLVGAVAAGLIAFGLFQIAKERFRRFNDG
jgi:hypothetical protein